MLCSNCHGGHYIKVRKRMECGMCGHKTPGPDTSGSVSEPKTYQAEQAAVKMRLKIEALSKKQ